MKRRISTLLLLFWIVALALPAAAAQRGTQPPSSNPPLLRGEKKGKGDDENVRSIQGQVWTENEQPVEGAVVKLKDTKTLRVRSFITQADGSYRFHGLSTNVDYQVWADYRDMTSDQRTLSVFDSRKQAVLNLKLDRKREEKN